MSVIELDAASRSEKNAPPCRQPGYRPTYANRSLGSGRGHIVPAHLLWSTLKPMLERLNEELDETDDTGAARLAAERASLILGTTGESVYRRLYDVHYGRTRTARAEYAEALLDGFNVRIDEADVLVVPAGLPAALEQIDARCEAIEFVPSPAERREMAEDLLEWSRLVIHDGLLALQGEADVIPFPSVPTPSPAAEEAVAA